MNKYRFLDYSLGILFNNGYAIEPEISSKFYLKEFANHDKHNESSAIYELINVHKGTHEEIMETYTKIKDFYKDKFPLGRDKFLSGGVHFHIFNGNFKGLSGDDVKYNLLNVPLFGKISKQKMYLRNTSYSRFRDYVGNNCKSSAVSYKTNYWSHAREQQSFRNSSIEFRCNNVFDARLYGYYVGIIIASKEGTKFKKTSDNFRNILTTGSTDKYTSADVELSTIKGYRITEEDFSTMSVNILRIIKLLELHSLRQAALALKEYVNEIGFDIQYDVSIKDMFTLETIEGIPLEVKSFKLFRVDTGDLFFSQEENFYSFIHEKLKARLLYAGIAGALVDIGMPAIKKKYEKLIVKPVPGTYGELESQNSLF